MSRFKQIRLPNDLDQANVIHCMSLNPEAATAVMELTTAVAIGGSMLELRGLVVGSSL